MLYLIVVNLLVFGKNLLQKPSQFRGIPLLVTQFAEKIFLNLFRRHLKRLIV
jgi:hypothetical protein